MAFEIDPLSPVPSYRQLAAILRERIVAGVYKPGEPIPSLVRLGQETGLAKNTITAAMDLLAEEGLIVRVSGRGTFVARK